MWNGLRHASTSTPPSATKTPTAALTRGLRMVIWAAVLSCDAPLSDHHVAVRGATLANSDIWSRPNGFARLANFPAGIAARRTDARLIDSVKGPGGGELGIASDKVCVYDYTPTETNF